MIPTNRPATPPTAAGKTRRAAILNLSLLLALFGYGNYLLESPWVALTLITLGLLLGGELAARTATLQRYRDFAKVSSDLRWETDARGRFTDLNGILAQLFKLRVGQRWRTQFPAAPDLVVLKAAITACHPFRNLELSIQLSPRQPPRWVRINGIPLIDESGQLRGYRGTALDITPHWQAREALRTHVVRLEREVVTIIRELRLANQELVDRERHLRILVNAAPVGIAELDLEGHCRYLNPVGCALTDCAEQAAWGRHFFDFVHPDSRDYVKFAWDINRASSQVHWIEFRLRGSGRWVSAYWAHLFEAVQQPLSGSVLIFSDVTETRRKDQQLRVQAHYDSLTELPNRILFRERLEQTLRRAKRERQNVALLWIDLDDFKELNDRLGHAAGDELLQQVAVRLRNRLRDSDTVARMGGDEFAAILPAVTDLAAATRVAEALLVRLAEPFTLTSGVLSVSASIGLALYPLHSKDAEALAQSAEAAMAAAKQAGKNQVALWQPPVAEPADQL
jgi:diguanylate cyclase (GGDEF)-like protein/PAS domain S-box-containing protein